MASLTASTGTATSDSSAGDVAWTSPGNVTSSDESDASAALTAAQTTEYLKCTNFDFSSLPDRAWIDGITDKWERSSSGLGACNDTEVIHFFDGSYQGDDKTVGTNFPAGTDTVQSFGGTSDTWSLAYTPSEIKDTSNGIGYRAAHVSGSPTANIDHVERDVEYTIQPVIRSPHALNGLGAAGFFSNPLG